ncbi:MAG TPA: serine/threonine-protein kinase [Gemmatimonadaceae bacterium]|nr:serine/threonine-protein kinase [Gemmatimonadaceae bacterium]
MTIPRFGNSELPTQQLSESELLRVALEDDYEIIEEIGRGGMAIVLRAREKALDREVAIKVLPARLAVDMGFVERFEHEARTAAKLEHPNIVPIYRVGRGGPRGEVSYFVMKLLRGQSLSAVLQERGKLEAGDVRRILMETASALGYAAKRSIVHRDIKPDNIMLDSEGRCVITDFGIAKAPGGQQTTAGISLGTPRYMSPEHAMGAQLDGRSDIYSLGVVAYQCLTGNPPYEADEPFAVLYKHIHDPLPEPTLASDDERQLYGVIARMLAKKPDDRFQNGQELIAALGGQASDPMLVASMMTNPGLMAPTELMPTPKPWYMPWWLGLSRPKQRLVVGLAGIATIAAVGLAVDSWLSDATAAPSGTPVGTAARPPAIPGVTVMPADSLKPRGPSARAATILAYNKLRSRCPTQDTLPSAKPIEYAVMLDSVADRPRAERMDVVYHVCGLSRGSPIATEFTLTKLRQWGLGQQKPHKEHAPNLTDSPRSREKWTLDTREMSAGDYRLEVVVTDPKKRQVSATREFRILDK